MLSLCAVAVLAAGCRRSQEPLPGAATEPAAAVRQLVQHLHDDDLAGYARAAVPPAQYAELEAAWAQGHSRWPLDQLPLHDKLPALLATLSAADAETRLQRAFKAQIAGQAAGVRQAAHSLGLFGEQYISHQGDYSADERAHYVQLVKALSAWAQAAPLSDPKLARSAITTFTTAARATGLDSDAALQAAGMTGSLQRLSPFAAASKQVLASYGLSLDESVAQMRTGLSSQDGDSAVVHVQYPLAGHDIDLQVALQRRQGHWYLARTLAEVDAVLAAARAAAPPPVEGEAPRSGSGNDATTGTGDSLAAAAKP
ncbi:hypothetical protein [Stenotrophomonas sp. 17(2023)]|uniref:hypothetical protein n=1 Tax=Stenotrophomonas sp. 17(2023) TaxID=3051123 RepID=UPI001CF5EDEA|nr:hypothetical protein [Stenotrophomonas sp. 17(2023)]MCE4074364.1 hypothetical protein [Stenotrophomonas acidaminiphila]